MDKMSVLPNEFASFILHVHAVLMADGKPTQRKERKKYFGLVL